MDIIKDYTILGKFSNIMAIKVIILSFFIIIKSPISLEKFIISYQNCNHSFDYNSFFTCDLISDIYLFCYDANIYESLFYD